MDKFYDETSHWCLGANVKKPVKIAMNIKCNNITEPFNVLEGNSTNQINIANQTNYNLIITDYDEKHIDRIKPIIEQIIEVCDK